MATVAFPLDGESEPKSPANIEWPNRDMLHMDRRAKSPVDIFALRIGLRFRFLNGSTPNVQNTLIGGEGLSRMSCALGEKC